MSKTVEHAKSPTAVQVVEMVGESKKSGATRLGKQWSGPPKPTTTSPGLMCCTAPAWCATAKSSSTTSTSSWRTPTRAGT